MKKEFTLRIKLNKGTYVGVAFFVTTIGNSSFLTKKGLDEIVTYLGISLLLFGIIISRFKNRHTNKQIHRISFRLFLIVEFFFSIGILMQNIDIILKIKLLLTMFFVVAFALLADDFIDSLENVRQAAYGVLYGTLITTGFAIIGRESLTSIAVEGAMSSGFNGGLQHKNYFACAMLAVFSAFYLYDKYGKKRKSNKRIMVISLALLIISNSRGALIMTFVFVVASHYDALLKIKARHRGLFIFTICGSAVIGAALIYSFVISDSASYMIRMKGLMTYINLYKNDLFHMWYGNAEMAWKNGNYVNNVRAVIGWDGTVELSFLSILVKNGIWGYFGYVIIFLFYIKKGLSIDNWKIKSMILSLSLSLLSSALVENYITNTHVIYGIFNYCIISGLIGQSGAKKTYNTKNKDNKNVRIA